MSPSPLAAGQAAHLELPGLDGLAVRVEEVAAERVRVTSVLALPVAARRLRGAQGELTVATPRGIVHVPAQITGASDDGRLEATLLAEGTVDQRREHFRLSALVPGVVAPADGSLPPLHTSTLDVSAGGVLVMGAGPVAPGTRVRLTLRLGEPGPLEVEGTVRRRTDAGHVAVEFDGLEGDAREALVRWIFERQRRARQAGLDGG